MTQLAYLTDMPAAKPYAEQCIAVCKTSANLRTLTGCLEQLAGLEQASGNHEPSATVGPDLNEPSPALRTSY
jgi:hypothetical protein